MPWAINHLPAGLDAGIDPAGEMWSVVIESPNMLSARAPVIGRIPGGVSVIPSKKGGFLTYVESTSHAYRSPSGTGRLRQLSSPWKTFEYCALNISAFTERRISSSTSFGAGQMSRRKTGPSLPTPTGSVLKSMSILPASAYATTSGGDAR